MSDVPIHRQETADLTHAGLRTARRLPDRDRRAGRGQSAALLPGHRPRWADGDHPHARQRLGPPYPARRMPRPELRRANRRRGDGRAARGIPAAAADGRLQSRQLRQAVQAAAGHLASRAGAAPQRTAGGGGFDAGEQPARRAADAGRRRWLPCSLFKPLSIAESPVQPRLRVENHTPDRRSTDLYGLIRNQ